MSDSGHTGCVGSMIAVVAFEQTWRRREIEPKFVVGNGSELEVRYAQLEKRNQVLEASLHNERKVNKELEADLQTAVNEGIKYRDHLACMLDLREKDAKEQENVKQKDAGERQWRAAIATSLEEAEKNLEQERTKVHALQDEITAYVEKVICWSSCSRECHPIFIMSVVCKRL